jgi:hypothetical protein
LKKIIKYKGSVFLINKDLKEIFSDIKYSSSNFENEIFVIDEKHPLKEYIRDNLPCLT